MWCQRSIAGPYPLPPSLHPHLGLDSRCMGLLKFAQLLNVVHQVAPGDIFHHKIQAILGRSGRGLEARTCLLGGQPEQSCAQAWASSILSGRSWVAKWTVSAHSRQTGKVRDSLNQKPRATSHAPREAPKILIRPTQNLHLPHPVTQNHRGSGPALSEWKIGSHHRSLEILGPATLFSTPTHTHRQFWTLIRNQSCSGLTCT